MSQLLLTGGRVIDPANNIDMVADILIRDGKIAAVGKAIKLDSGAKVEKIKLKGMVVCPGLIDMHVHLREPGQTAKENMATGTRAAALGGFTSVVCMPNTNPPIENASTVAFIREKAAKEGFVNVFITGAITKGLAGEEMASIGSLKNAGVVALTDDGHCVQNNDMMRRAVEYAGMCGLPVLDHCQDYSSVTDGVMNEGYWSLLLGLRGWPAVGEDIVVGRNVLLAEQTGGHIHCQHVSTAGSVEQIRQARKRGIRISGETCPHYFTLTDAAIAGSEAFWENDGKTLEFKKRAGDKLPYWPNYDTHFKMNPPLRTLKDREAVIEGLVDGTIEAIASDHAPHCDFEKEVEFDYAPFGITGLETQLSLSLTQLYHSKKMSLPDVIAKFTVGPARLLNLKKGTLSVGADADITVIDTEVEWSMKPSDSASKSRNSPFFGWPLKGKAVRVFVGGKSIPE